MSGVATLAPPPTTRRSTEHAYGSARPRRIHLCLHFGVGPEPPSRREAGGRLDGWRAERARNPGERSSRPLPAHVGPTLDSAGGGARAPAEGPREGLDGTQLRSEAVSFHPRDHPRRRCGSHQRNHRRSRLPGYVREPARGAEACGRELDQRQLLGHGDLTAEPENSDGTRGRQAEGGRPECLGCCCQASSDRRMVRGRAGRTSDHPGDLGTLRLPHLPTHAKVEAPGNLTPEYK